MNKKSTKRSLLLSALSLVLCLSMLVGTTFAWFTDSVTSGKNKIVAGNLDVELEYAKVVDGRLQDWATVEGKDAIFNPNALWEPGRVEVVYLKVSNLGTLALKYQLGVNVLGETPSVSVETDKEFKLSDYLVFKTVEMPNALTTYTDREAAQVAAGTEMGLKDYNSKATTLEVGGTDYVALIVYMPETVGNEANYKKDAPVPTIELGVNLFATQVEAESDSYGPDYDKDSSAFVSTAEELRTALATVKDGGTVYVNDGVYNIDSQLNISGKSINIVGTGEDAVIHMTDTRQNYNKIFYIYGSATEGKDITVNISNVTLTADVATKSDIWIRTDTQNGTKVSGDVTVNLDNVTCTSIICDNNYVDGDTINLNITNSNVKKVTLDASPFNGNGLNTYTNLIYKGSRIDSINIQPGVNELTHITINGVSPTSHGEQQTLTYVDTEAELKAALENPEVDSIIVSAGTYGVIDVRVNRNLTIAAADGATVKFAGVNGQTNNNETDITFKGIIIDNTLATEGWYTGTSQKMMPCVGVWGGNYTFDDCEFYVSGESKKETGVMSWWTTEVDTMYFKNCTFNGGNDSARAMQIYGHYDLTVEGCTFNTEKDYSIKYVGVSGTTATFKNNKVYETVNFVQTGSAPYAGKDYALVFEGNTLADGINHVYVDNDENQTITIEGKRWVGSAAQLAAAVAEGTTDIYLLDGEYNVYGLGGKTLTISGSRNAVLKLYNEGEDGVDYGFGDSGNSGGSYTINGVTVDTTANTGNYKGYAYHKSMTFNDCKFFGAYAVVADATQTFNDCEFDFNDGYFWTWGAKELNFNNCTFVGKSKAILAHGYAATVINIDKCTFAATEKGYASNGTVWTSAVEIDPAGTNTYTIKFTETTVNDNYSGWTRVKDGSTGHIITGAN